MLIDWFTVFAQMINLIILVWLLKKILYKPIINAVQTREQFVQQQLLEAERKTAESEMLMAEYSAKNQSFEDEREESLKKAKEEVSNTRHELMEEAKLEYEQLRSKQKEILQAEENLLQKEFIQKTQAEVLQIARKTLADLASVSLENQMVQVFAKRLETLDKSEKEILVKSVKVSQRAILIRSVFDITSEQRQVLKKLLNEHLDEEIEVEFELKPTLLSGIELVTDGYKLSWNMDEYLHQLSKRTIQLANSRNNA
jgi:F-type H+-transporting ATPase subunit b